MRHYPEYLDQEVTLKTWWIVPGPYLVYIPGSDLQGLNGSLFYIVPHEFHLSIYNCLDICSSYHVPPSPLPRSVLPSSSSHSFIPCTITPFSKLHFPVIESTSSHFPHIIPQPLLPRLSFRLPWRFPRPLPHPKPLSCHPETLYHRDGALLYIAYVMFIWAAPIPADSWHCSLWP